MYLVIAAQQLQLKSAPLPFDSCEHIRLALCQSYTIACSHSQYSKLYNLNIKLKF